jgi:hypothetical protein
MWVQQTLRITPRDKRDSDPQISDHRFTSLNHLVLQWHPRLLSGRFVARISATSSPVLTGVYCFFSTLPVTGFPCKFEGERAVSYSYSGYQFVTRTRNGTQWDRHLHHSACRNTLTYAHTTLRILPTYDMYQARQQYLSLKLGTSGNH